MNVQPLIDALAQLQARQRTVHSLVRILEREVQQSARTTPDEKCAAIVLRGLLAQANRASGDAVATGQAVDELTNFQTVFLAAEQAA